MSSPKSTHNLQNLAVRMTPTEFETIEYILQVCANCSFSKIVFYNPLLANIYDKVVIKKFSTIIFLFVKKILPNFETIFEICKFQNIWQKLFL